MLKARFNKFSGTEIRTKHQVRFYLMLIAWIREKQNECKTSQWSKEKWDTAYKKWTKSEEIYHYKNDKKIPIRFGFIIANLKKLGIAYSNGIFEIPQLIDSHSIFNKMINYQNAANVKPFQAMVDFAIANPAKNEAKKIIQAFLVYDGKETFAKLYNIDVTSKLASQETSLIKFKKPPAEKKYLAIVAAKLKSAKPITIDDLAGYESLSSKTYIKPAFSKERERFNLDLLIARINRCSYQDFIYKINKNKIKALLEKDYFDLFSRWLYDFGLIDTSGKNPKVFYNFKLQKTNGGYKIKNNQVTKYPFTYEQTRNFILKIAQRNFSFKNEHSELKRVGNSIIAEYFVNLFCCFRLKIKPSHFTSYVQTKVTHNLHPIFTAPGGKPDMSYTLANNLIINVETTILSTKRQIQNQEIFSTTEHLVESIKKQKVQKSYLIFVSPLDPQAYKNDFAIVFDKKVPQGKLITHNFENLLAYDFSQITNF